MHMSGFVFDHVRISDILLKRKHQTKNNRKNVVGFRLPCFSSSPLTLTSNLINLPLHSVILLSYPRSSIKMVILGDFIQRWVRNLPGPGNFAMVYKIYNFYYRFRKSPQSLGSQYRYSLSHISLPYGNIVIVIVRIYRYRQTTYQLKSFCRHCQINITNISKYKS